MRFIYLFTLVLAVPLLGCRKNNLIPDEKVFLDHSSREIKSTIHKNLSEAWHKDFRMIGSQPDTLRTETVTFRIWLPAAVTNFEDLQPNDSRVASCVIAKSSWLFERQVPNAWVVDLSLRMKDTPKDAVVFTFKTNSGSIQVSCTPQPKGGAAGATKFSNEWKEVFLSEARALLERVPDSRPLPTLKVEKMKFRNGAVFSVPYEMVIVRKSGEDYAAVIGR